MGRRMTWVEMAYIILLHDAVQPQAKELIYQKPPQTFFAHS